ncbi:MAG: hypothetical protein M1819_005236 [Sarea resinae]|nr:MAG: hypothetical protein M1819_005236 [Sarea resinae]
MLHSACRPENLPRPPTPPRGSLTDLKGVPTFGDFNSSLGDLSPLQPLDTPPNEYPSSSAESGKSTKRVGFSPWTDYHKAPSYHSNSPGLEKILRPLPPSRERKSSKSILKPYDKLVPLLSTTNSTNTGGHSVHRFASFAAMLESVVQQLAREGRSSRLDAYISLSGTLKAYDGVPDAKAMAEKMGLFMQFIRRDMSARMPESDALDTQLITQALKLLTIFLWTPQLSENLNEEFRSFIIDHTISVLDDSRVSKAIINHYMHLLAHQKFSGRIMTADRANRIITSLATIEDRVTGSGIIGERLMVYGRLLNQSRAVMITRVGDWIEHLFSGMLSTVKEIRVRAITFGIESGLALGAVEKVSQAMMEIFDRDVDTEKFADYLGTSLNKMVTVKENGAVVPQIWSVVVLFLRSRCQCRRHRQLEHRQLEHWEHFKLWLYTIQRCFNSNDLLIKFQANLAWNKLIFAINPDADTSLSIVKVLRQPIIGQLERRGSDKQSKKGRQMGFSSYCMLLYYALRPSATEKQLDLYWREYVSQLLQNSSFSMETSQACQLLNTLFRGPQATWNENRAMENEQIKVEELPRLDPRWIRSRLHLILPVIRAIFKRGSANDSEGNSRSEKVWHSLMQSMADAGTKEVTISLELMEAVAHVFNTLQEIWLEGPSAVSATNDTARFLKVFHNLVRSTVYCLGAVVFTEKIISRDSQNSFEAASTPSRRASRNGGALQSPLNHLLLILSRPSPATEGTTDCGDMAQMVLEASCQFRSSRKARLELLRDCILVVFPQSTNGSKSLQLSALWRVISESACAALSQKRDSSPMTSDSPQPVGQEYREVLRILEAGSRFADENVLEAWHKLFNKFIEVVRTETGDAGVILAVIEPMANGLRLQGPDQPDWVYVAKVIEKTTWPQNRQALDRARKALWGTVPSTQKSSNFDPFNHLYEMIDIALEAGYRRKPFGSNDITAVLSALTGFIKSCQASYAGILLKRVQKGVALWAQDPEQKVNTSNPSLAGLYSIVCPDQFCI